MRTFLSLYLFMYIYIHRLVNLVEARVGGGVLEFLFTSATPHPPPREDLLGLSGGRTPVSDRLLSALALVVDEIGDFGS